METLRNLFLAALLLMSVSCCDSKQKVVICDNGAPKVYHKDDKCPAMQRCKREHKQITLQEAKKQGRGECSFCYGGKKHK